MPLVVEMFAELVKLKEDRDERLELNDIAFLEKLDNDFDSIKSFNRNQTAKVVELWKKYGEDK